MTPISGKSGPVDNDISKNNKKYNAYFIKSSLVSFFYLEKSSIIFLI